MSHKHRHNHNAQPQQAPAVTAPSEGREEVVQQPVVQAEQPVAAPEVVPPEPPQQENVQTPPPQPVEEPKVTITPEEPASPKADGSQPQPAKPTRTKIMSSEILKPKVASGSVFQQRRANNIVNGRHTIVGTRLLKTIDEYRTSMAVPTRDRDELARRIRKLQEIVNTACPTKELDLQTATDVVRIMFDEFMKNWGTIYTDSNIFLLGNTLKGTAYELDKLVIFVEAFVQMVEGASEKKKVLFDDTRLRKVLKNGSVVTAMCRIRDNINTRNGFPTIAK